MDKAKGIVPVFGTGFTAIEKDFYRRIRAEGADTVEEREAIREESEKMNTVSLVPIYKRGSKLSALHNVRNATKVGTVAVIPVKGVMKKYSSGYWFRTVGTQEIAQHIKAAQNNPMVTAIVMDFDTGGGMVDGNYVFCDVVYEAREDKPVYGYVNGMAASAGFQAAAQCTKLFVAGPTDYVGSIGVFQMHVDESGYLEQWGLKVSYIVADGGDDKIVAPSTQALSDEDRKKVVAQLNELRTTMISQIERGRGNRIKPTEATYRGGIFTAKEAKKMGLIDGTASLEEVILKAYRAGEKKKKSNGSGTASIINNSNSMNWNLKTVISGLFGNDNTPTFSEDQVLTASEATQFAKQTAEVIEQKNTAETDLKAEQDKVAQLETDLKAEQEKVTGLETDLKAEQDKVAKLETDLKAEQDKVAQLEAKGPEGNANGEGGGEGNGEGEGEGEGNGEGEGSPEGNANGEGEGNNQLGELAEQVTALATEMEQLKAEKALQAKKAETLEAKYKKVVSSYKELADAQGKGGHLDEEEEGNGNGNKSLGNSSKLPPVSKYVRQMGVY